MAFLTLSVRKQTKHKYDEFFSFEYFKAYIHFTFTPGLQTTKDGRAYHIEVFSTCSQVMSSIQVKY